MTPPPDRPAAGRGHEVFVKRRSAVPASYFRSEAAGLRWLAEPGEVPVPAVLEEAEDHLVLERVPSGHPSAEGARRFGAQLARLHAAGAEGFGAPWPGFIGPLPMPNEACASWPAFYAERRVRPFLSAAVRHGALPAAGARAVEAALELLDGLPGSEEPPSRIHGDLWSGNLLWDPGGRAWLIDPAAHGGHRETDLAMLALFGAPHLGEILGAYEAERPLAPGWPDRVGIHQLHPLLVHAVLFGPFYGRQAEDAAREALGRHR